MKNLILSLFAKASPLSSKQKTVNFGLGSGPGPLEHGQSSAPEPENSTNLKTLAEETDANKDQAETQDEAPKFSEGDYETMIKSNVEETRTALHEGVDKFADSLLPDRIDAIKEQLNKELDDLQGDFLKAVEDIFAGDTSLDTGDFAVALTQRLNQLKSSVADINKISNIDLPAQTEYQVGSEEIKDDLHTLKQEFLEQGNLGFDAALDEIYEGPGKNENERNQVLEQGAVQVLSGVENNDPKQAFGADKEGKFDFLDKKEDVRRQKMVDFVKERRDSVVKNEKFDPKKLQIPDGLPEQMTTELQATKKILEEKFQQLHRFKLPTETPSPANPNTPMAGEKDMNLGEWLQTVTEYESMFKHFQTLAQNSDYNEHSTEDQQSRVTLFKDYLQNKPGAEQEKPDVDHAQALREKTGVDTEETTVAEQQPTEKTEATDQPKEALTGAKAALVKEVSGWFRKGGNSDKNFQKLAKENPEKAAETALAVKERRELRNEVNVAVKAANAGNSLIATHETAQKKIDEFNQINRDLAKSGIHLLDYEDHSNKYTKLNPVAQEKTAVAQTEAIQPPTKTVAQAEAKNAPPAEAADQAGSFQESQEPTSDQLYSSLNDAQESRPPELDEETDQTSTETTDDLNKQLNQTENELNAKHQSQEAVDFVNELLEDPSCCEKRANDVDHGLNLIDQALDTIRELPDGDSKQNLLTMIEAPQSALQGKKLKPIMKTAQELLKKGENPYGLQRPKKAAEFAQKIEDEVFNKIGNIPLSPDQQTTITKLTEQQNLYRRIAKQSIKKAA